MTPEEFKAKVQRNMAANPGASEAEVREALASAGFTDPSGDPINLQGRIKGAVQPVIRGANKVLEKARQGTSDMMGPVPDAAKELINPVPGNLGELGAILGAGAGGRAAGVGRSLARATGPVVGGLAGDVASGDEDMVANAIIRGAAGLGFGEAVGGIVSLYKRLFGLTRAADTAQIARRLAETGNRITRNARPMTGEVDDLVRAGEKKPSMGNPLQSDSLEAALDQRFKSSVKTAVEAAGPNSVVITMPDGTAADLPMALDMYARLRSQGATAGAAKAGGGNARAEAAKLWDDILVQLKNAGEQQDNPGALLALGILQRSRQDLAQGMSFGRLIQGIKGRGIVDAKGRIDPIKLQKRFHELADKGQIDPSVRDQLEAAVKRGSTGAQTDVPGQINLGTWMRFGHGAPSMGMHPQALVNAQLPVKVGTGATGMAPETEPFEGLGRLLLSIGSQTGAQNVKRAGESE